jgi:DNA-binding transcriptional ArsR family regulator
MVKPDPAPIDEPDPAALDRVFAALADPVRRAILRRLDGRDLLVSELAEPFAISLQAVSRHIQVLVRAGLVTQERTGRISRCRLDAGPIYQAAVWVNRYSKYWQAQFDTLAAWLDEIERRKAAPATPALPRPKLKRSRRRA